MGDACRLGRLFRNFGARVPGDQNPRIGIRYVGQISVIGCFTDLAARATRTDGQHIHARRQVLRTVQWGRATTAAATTTIPTLTGGASTTAAAHQNVIAAFNVKGRRVLRAGHVRRMHRKQTLLMHGV